MPIVLEGFSSSLKGIFILSVIGTFTDLESLFSNPVAITVTITLSPKSSFIVVPNIISASGSTDSRIKFAASLASSKPKFEPPLILINTPLAPSILVSNNGLCIAALAAISVLFSPEACPIPI